MSDGKHDLNSAQVEVLGWLWNGWPEDRIGWSAPERALTRIRVLERRGLATWEPYYDNHDWPPRPTRKSDLTWNARLTPEGEQEALRRGLPFHSAEDCPRAAANGCAVHFAADPMPLPVLLPETEEDA